MKKVLLTCLVVFSVAALKAQKEVKAYVVSNAHFDSQWNWDVRTSIDQYVYNTLVRNLWLLDNYPDYVFNFEGGVKYQWMKEYYPYEYERIKKYIAEGRWHIAGSTWDATDPNIPSPESFFRNILYGQQFYKKEFGVTSTDIFLPDCFGFGYTLPTVAAHAGLIGFSTQKLQWRQRPFHGNSKVPFTLGLWQGVDGSRIMAAPDARNYTFSWKGEDISYNRELMDLAKQSPTGIAYRYYGTGDIGGSPTIASVVSVEKGVQGKGPVKIISATSDQLFKDFLPFDQHPELPVYDGELLMDVHATGCYTSQSAMKRFNRRNEQLGDAAERAAVIADFLGGMAYPSEVLSDSWKRFIWHQFHDDLTGTSIPRAYTYSWNDELIAQTRFAGIIQAATGVVAEVLDTRVKGTPVVVYNPLSTIRKEVVEIEIPAPSAAGVTVYAPDGKALPTQKLAYKNGKLQVLFRAEVAPVSYGVYDVRMGEKNVRSVLKVGKNTLENDIYKLTLNAQGDIASLFDKRFNREMVEKGKAFRLALFTENESFNWPAWEILKKTMDTEPASIDENVRINVVEQGPVRATLKVERTKDSTLFVQYIRLTAGSDRIDIVNEIDWASTNALLKAEFPFSFGNPQATYDLGIGTIQRGNNTDIAYEVYAQQWADLTATDQSYGVAIMNNCKYGWDKPDDHTLRLTLLHTPKTNKAYKYQNRQDLGHHSFTYSIVGHAGTPLKQGAAVAWKAEELNNPLLAFVASKHKGELGREYSFLKVNTPQMALKTLKKSEDGKWNVVRFYEQEGRKAERIEVTFPTEIEEAVELSGAEEVIGTAHFEGNKLIFSTIPYKPKTFGVRLKKNKEQVQPVSACPLELVYNGKAFTPDAFSYTGEFDGKGNSYAAELIGNKVVADGIPFTIAPVDEKNVVKCKKDVIALPLDKEYRRLYILAAATDKDRKADFKVDGKTYTFDVPYYSGFYGQWGHTGHTKGYVKKAPIAYIGSHRHTRKGNEAYVFTYMFKLALDIPAGAKILELPDDEHIAVFAVTAAEGNNLVVPAMEMRALPKME